VDRRGRILQSVSEHIGKWRGDTTDTILGRIRAYWENFRNLGALCVSRLIPLLQRVCIDVATYVQLSHSGRNRIPPSPPSSRYIREVTSKRAEIPAFWPEFPANLPRRPVAEKRSSSLLKCKSSNFSEGQKPMQVCGPTCSGEFAMQLSSRPRSLRTIDFVSLVSRGCSTGKSDRCGRALLASFWPTSG
jgi:hypothetical protein